ncbi:nidogen-1-like [Diadema setosum]|uniref:nidogen-1-like n=1 Tax=Diadema setosum TaxID=31175 RepID=UPI003B3AF5E7
MKLFIAIFAFVVTVVNCLPREKFFDFGTDAGDKKLLRGNRQPVSLTFAEPFTFLGEEHNSLYLARDGYVSLSPSTRDTKIAPFKTKLKMPRKTAFVWYRTTVSAADHEKIINIIQRNFRNRGSLDVSTFNPTSHVVVTWDNMAVRDKSHTVIGTVTFQLILVADATHSFAFFLYDDENRYPKPSAIEGFIDAGFTSGRDPSQWEFEMVYSEGSKAAALFEAMRDSNVGRNGMWAYQIDGRLDGNIYPAVPMVQPVQEERPQADSPPEAGFDLQLDAANTFDVEVLAFEDQCTKYTCSVNARCVTYPTGHCCSCNEGFIGNGLYCDPVNENRRLNARVNGTVNGINLGNDLYLHTFVMAEGGRTFTAISPLPQAVAYSMQLLLPIGELMGWLFAEPASKGINGFMQTGANLEYSANVVFRSGERVSIRQILRGLDNEGENLGLVTIEGTLPLIQQGLTITVESQSVVYTKNRPGYVYSEERRMLQAGSDSVEFTVEQTITFQECEADDINTDASLTAMRMNTSYAYSMFETEEEILRYAMITAVGPDAGVPTNPCQNNNCDVNARCLAQGTSFECRCNPGYTGDGFLCAEQQANPCENHNCDANADCYPTSNDGYTCQCRPDFTGDGFSCRRDTINNGGNPCDTNDCHRYAYCYPVQDSFYCECAPGFSGDGRICERDEPVDPCENNRCDPNAQCRPVEGGYTCSCNPGYQGDGYRCNLPDQLVSLCSDCSTEADCLPEGRGYRCLCRAGFQGNGITCEDINECVEGVEIACDPNAQCYNTRGSYTCYCRSGFRGNGFTCEGLPQAEGALVYGQGMSVMYRPLDGQSGNKVFMRTRQTVVGVAYDCQEEKVYWSDISGRTIMRSSMDGRDASVVVNTSLSSPEGIAIDHLSRNIYWTDSGNDRIEVANLDGRNRHVLFDTDLENPRAIVVDPVGGYLYWADWGRRYPKIERSFMDGTNREVMVDSNLVMPNGLTIDTVSQLLCWADAGTSKVECMNLNGDPQSRYTVYNNAQYPFAMTSMGYNLYWTAWQINKIESINKNGGQEAETYSLPRGGNGKVYGLAAVTACPAGNNRCAAQNGGCRNLCLPTPETGFTCTCPNALTSNEIPCN